MDQNLLCRTLSCPQSSVNDPIAAIESAFGVRLPGRRRSALLDARDPIHSYTLLLCAEGESNIFDVNRDVRAAGWKAWPDSLVAFAYDGCLGLFAYDTRVAPYRVYYIDPMESAVESIAAGEAEGFVFSSFDEWYAELLTREPAW